MISKSICYSGEIVKTLPGKIQSIVTLFEGDDYEKFGKILRVYSLKGEFSAELLPPLTLVTRLVHSVNVATNDIKGDKFSGYDDRSVNSTISVTYRSIMTMKASGKEQL